jgi:glycine cleavage system H protein
MMDFLETITGKFIFRVATDRFYTPEGVWARLEDGLVRIGLSDFQQQRNGDVAFVELKPEGTKLASGDEVATIETIKVNIALGSPVSGEVVKINADVIGAPESINQDPYEAGWLATIQPVEWEADLEHLLDPEAYFARMKAEAEEEIGR